MTAPAQAQAPAQAAADDPAAQAAVPAPVAATVAAAAAAATSDDAQAPSQRVVAEKASTEASNKVEKTSAAQEVAPPTLELSSSVSPSPSPSISSEGTPVDDSAAATRESTPEDADMVEPAPLGSTVPGGFPQPQQKQQQQQQQQQLRLKAADVDLNDHNAFFEKHMPPQQGEIVEDQAGFHWEIDNVRSKLDTEKMVVSPTFNCRGHNWRLKWFPRGIHGNSIQSSIFVDYADAEEHKNERIGICIRYAVVLSAPDDFTRYNVKTSSNRISNAATDWGWADFIYYSDLFRSLPGYSGPFVDKESDKMFVHGFIQVINDPDGFRWADLDKINPRLDLGYVGLSNQGATCYMNSMLQSLFCTNALRKATYEIPVSIEELQGEKKSMTHALQRLFYQLQVSPRAVDTIELTRSFGWDDADAYLQHDVQEFNRVLQDNLETKMKGTVVEGAIEKFFVGKMKSYIKCINVDYESSRTENFYDIQLNVKGCNNLRDSFVEYISVETLDGDNQYMADGHGLQDARKGVVFESFPPVLHLQLKRFEYDFELDRMAKNNDRFEFPESIDLTQFLSEDSSQQKENNNYILHGVLVHAGSIDGGHYYAMLKPEKNGRWMKFDDDNVIPVSNEDAIERYFGGGSATDSYDPRMGMHMRRMRRVSANAYMLVYIRESHLDDILAPVTANDVPQHLLNVMAEQEALERQRREKAEMERLRREELQKNMTVRIVTSEMTVGHSGYDMVYFDKRQSRNNPVLTIRFPKHASIQDLRRYIVAQFYNQKTGKIEVPKRTADTPSVVIPSPIGGSSGQTHAIPFEYPQEGSFDLDLIDKIPIRLWLITRRENQSLRPLDIPFEHNNTSTLTEQLVRTGINELRIFAELPSEINKVLPPIATSHTDGYYMMFAKYYNAEEHTLRGSGVVYVKNSDKIDNVKLRLNKLVGLKEDTPLTVWEEVVDRKLDPIVPDLTVKQQDSTSGDVLVFQIETEFTKAHQEHYIARASGLTTAKFPHKAPMYEYFDLIHYYYMWIHHSLPIVMVPHEPRDNDDLFNLRNDVDKQIKDLDSSVDMPSVTPSVSNAAAPAAPTESAETPAAPDVDIDADLDAEDEHIIAKHPGSFKIVLDQRMSYAYMVEQVAKHVNWNPDNLIITPQDSFTKAPFDGFDRVAIVTNNLGEKVVRSKSLIQCLQQVIPNLNILSDRLMRYTKGNRTFNEAVPAMIWCFEKSHINWHELHQGHLFNIKWIASNVRDIINIRVFIPSVATMTVRDLIKATLDRGIIQLLADRSAVEKRRSALKATSASTASAAAVAPASASPSPPPPVTASISPEDASLAVDAPSSPAPAQSPLPSTASAATIASHEPWLDSEGNAVDIDQLISDRRIRVYCVQETFGSQYPSCDLDYDAEYANTPLASWPDIAMEIIPDDEFGVIQQERIDAAADNSKNEEPLAMADEDVDSDKSSVTETGSPQFASPPCNMDVIGSELIVQQASPPLAPSAVRASAGEQEQLGHPVSFDGVAENAPLVASSTVGGLTYATAPTADSEAMVDDSLSANDGSVVLSTDAAEKDIFAKPVVVAAVSYSSSAGSACHGIPFHLVLHPKETAAQLSQRLRLRLGMNEKEFSRVKLMTTHPSQGSAVRFKDDEVVLDTIKYHLSYILRRKVPDHEALPQVYSLAVDYPERGARQARFVDHSVKIRA